MSSSPPAAAARSHHARSHPAAGALRVLVCAAEGSAITRVLDLAGEAFEIERFSVPDLASLPEDLGTGWDVVVVEDGRPGWSADTLLDHIRARGVGIPVVVVCDACREVDGIALVERGAADCLASDRLGRLPLAVRAASEREALARELARAEVASASWETVVRVALEGSPSAVISVGPDARVIEWNATAERLLGWSHGEARGQRLVDLVGDDETGGRRLVGITQTSREGATQQQILPVRIHRRDGRALHFQVWAVHGSGVLPGVVLSLTDITDLSRADWLREHQLRVLHALAFSTDDTSLAGVMEQIAESVRGTEARFWESDPQGALHLRVSWRAAGSEPSAASLPAFPPALVARTIHTGRLGFSEAGPAGPAGEFLGIPVVSGEQVLGAVEIYAPGFPGFSDAYVAHLASLGSYLGNHVVRRRVEADFARSMEELSRISRERLRLRRLLVDAHEDERRVIAADIHDDSLQILAAAGLRLHTLRRRLDGEAPQRTLDAVEQMMGTAVSRLRGLMVNLRPPGLDRGDLMGTIRDRLVQVQQDEGIGYSLSGSEPAALTTATRVALYRVAQEAIANVVKHASADQIHVSLEEHEGGCLMRIADDGAGLATVTESQPGHVGLPGMRERTEVAGGWLRVEAGDARGTVVSAWVPLLATAPSDSGAAP